MNVTRIVVLLTLAIVLAVGSIVGCKKDKDREEIVLPTVVDQTGPIALYGKWAVNGMTMAVEEINKNGGIKGHKLRLVLEDGQSNPQIGVNAFQRLLSLYHPPVILVATNTSTIMACAPIANEKQVVLFTPIASGPNVTHAGDFVFRNRVSGYYEAAEMASFAIHGLGLTRVGLAVINNEAGPGYIEAFAKVFQAQGRKITETVLLDPGVTDYRTQVLKVRESNPEGVFLALTAKEAGTFIKQSEEIGFRPRWLSMTTVQSEEMLKTAGKAAEGLIFVAEGGDDGDPEYRDFALRYARRFASKPAMNALNGYDAVHLLAPLLAKEGASGPKVRDVLYNTRNFRGVGGNLSFDENGDARKPLMLMVVKSGKFVRLK